MVPLKQILELTGYIRGGCSPIGMKKKYPVFIDESCNNYDFIFISAGMRGMQMKVDPQELIKITFAQIADLV
jgi:Cys-tRNA(Pro)/Cys-tRNA(Cys) deacylase